MVNWEVIVVCSDFCLFSELFYVVSKEFTIDLCLAAVGLLRVLIGQLCQMMNDSFVS